MRAVCGLSMAMLCLGCLPAADSAPSQEAFESTRGPVESNPVSVEVSRTRSVSITSVDGDVKVTVPALSVEANTELVLAWLRSDLVPSSAIGSGYVLRVADGALVAPARVEWRVGPHITIPTRDLRIATLGPDGNLVALGGAQATTDSVAAEVDGAATLILVEKRALGSQAQDLPLHSAGDALLWRADVEGARAAYNTARQQGPNASAALGRALTDLLLLTKKPPLSDVLLRCGLPQEALLDAIVGPGGVFAQAAEDRAGDFALTLSDAAGTQTLLGDEVYARRHAGRTSLTARGDGFELRLTLPGGEIALGQRLNRAQLAADVELVHGGDRFTWPMGAAGTVTVYQRGAGLGGRVQIELSGVELSGAPGNVTVQSASIADDVTAVPDVVESLGVAATDGMMVVPIVSHVLMGCSEDVTLSWLVAGGASLSEKLGPIATDLAEAAGAEQSGPLLMLPPGLTRLPRSVPITARDARLLGAMVGVLRAGLLAVTAYEYAGLDAQGLPHPVRDWLDEDATLWRWTADGQLESKPAVLLDHALLSDELNAQFLTPIDGVEAVKATLRAAFVFLEGGLGDLRAAAKDTRSVDGMIRWTLLDAAGFSARLQEVADAAVRSMAEGTSGIPIAPGVGLNLSKLVDAPLTHAFLVARNGNEPLTISFYGAPQGRTPEARNATTLLNDHGVVDALWESFLNLDPGTGRTMCTVAEQDACGAGFACVPEAVGVCSGGGGACASDDGCLASEQCVRAHRCQRQAPAILEWSQVDMLWNGPQAPALGGWLWHLWQPLRGMDAARPSVMGR